MTRVLFIDEDLCLLRSNRAYFEQRDFQVFTAPRFEEALNFLQHEEVDCIVIGLSGEDSWTACQKLKEQRSTPVILLAGLNQQDHIYQAFEQGADDYMTKPYEMRELELRILARVHQFQRSNGEKILEFPPLIIDPSSRRASVGGHIIPLTAYEFDILLLLARQPGQLLSLEEIYRQVWKLPDLGSAQTVRVHLTRMRRKLEEAWPDHTFIELVWGKGFLFRDNQKEKPLA